jgi:hypothetical protein
LPIHYSNARHLDPKSVERVPEWGKRFTLVRTYFILGLAAVNKVGSRWHFWSMTCIIF